VYSRSLLHRALFRYSGSSAAPEVSVVAVNDGIVCPGSYGPALGGRAYGVERYGWLAKFQGSLAGYRMRRIIADGNCPPGPGRPPA
jgi:hypothetical protein